MPKSPAMSTLSLLRNSYKRFLLLLLVLAPNLVLGQRLMEDFKPVIKGLPIVRNMAVDGNGKVYVAGNLSMVGNQQTGSLVRLNPDGTLDETFIYGGKHFGGSYISDIVVSNDSIVLVVETDGLVVLKKDGSLDSGFLLDASIQKVYGATFLGAKYLVTAQMAGFNGPHSLLLLNRDGSVDETFAPIILTISSYWARFDFQSDGRILVIGGITEFNGEEAGKVIRLNTDLSLDHTFNTAHLSQPYHTIRDITLQSDDKILLTGNFTSYDDFETPGGVVRLNSDGTVDTDFIVGPVGNIINRGAYYASILSDGKIVVAGLNYSDYLKYLIVKLNDDGSINSQLTPNLIRYNDLDDLRMLVNADDEIIVAGDFVYYDSETFAGFAAFDVNGNTLPVNPKIGRTPFIKKAAIQGNGKVLLTGDFYEINGEEANQIARLNSDGSLDDTFDPDITLWNPQKSKVSSVAVQSDGKIIVGGYFVEVGLVDYYNNLIRLDENGALDLTFRPKVSPTFVDQGVTEIVIESNGDIVIGGSFGYVGSNEVRHFAKIDATGAVVSDFNADNIVPVYSWVNSIIRTEGGGYMVAGTGYNPNVGFIYTFDETGTYTGSLGDVMDLTYKDIQEVIILDNKLVFGGSSTGGGFINRGIPIHISNLDGTEFDDVSLNATDEVWSASFSSLIGVGGGELIVGGNFEKINGQSQSNLAKVKLNGFVDPNFDFEVKGSISFIAREDEETLLLFGQFSSINDIEYSGGVRLKFLNDIAQINAYSSTLSTEEDVSLEINLSDFVISDEDDNFPEDFTLVILEGENYSISGNAVTPDLNFNGMLTVAVKVSDGKDESEPYNLSIEVTPVNDIPVISGLASALSLDENTSLTLSLEDFIVTDPDNTFPDDFTLILEQGENYTLDGFTVVPVDGFNGTLLVKAKVSDGESTSDVFNAEVTVVSTNVAPVIDGTTSSLSTPEETGLTISLSSLSVTDPDDTFPNDFALSIEAGDHYTVAGLTIIPATDFNGVLTVPVKVNDGEADSPAYELSVSVAPINDVPVVSGYSGMLTSPEETALTIDLTSLTVADPDNSFPDDFTLSIEAGDNYTVAGTTITPATDFNGTLTVPVKVNDSEADSPSFELSVEVTPVNDVPVVSGYSGMLASPEETALTIDLTSLIVADPDNSFPDDFTLSIEAGDNYTVAGTTIIPATDFSGTLTVPVKVNDGEADSPGYELSVAVTPINDVPVVSGYSGMLTSPEETALTIDLASLTVADPDNSFPDDFTLSIEAGDNYTVAGTTITPATDFNGTLTVPIKVNDGEADSPGYELSVAVAPINDVPIVSGYSGTLITPEETALTIIMTSLTVIDPDNSFPDDFTLEILTGDNYTVVGSTIIPATNFNGTLTVPVKMNDGQADSPLYELSVQVTPVNDAPVITGYGGLLITPEDTPLTIELASFTVVDPDNSFPADFALSILAGENYVVAGNQVIPLENFYGSLTVPVLVSDGAAESPTFLLAIEVTAVNDIPVVVLYSGPLTTKEDTPLTLDINGFEVTDPDNTFPDDFQLVVSDGDNYSVDGATITPGLGFFGELSVGISVSDRSAVSEPLLLSVEVTPVASVSSIPDSSHIQIFPNPASERLSVHIKSASNGEVTLKLMDLRGKTILKSKHRKESLSFNKMLDVTGLNKGIYLLMIEFPGNGRFTQRVIVE